MVMVLHFPTFAHLREKQMSLESDWIDLYVGHVGVVLLGVDGHCHVGGGLVPVVPTVHHTLCKSG